MNKRTKLTCVILAAVLCAGFAAGCGKGEAQETAAQPTNITSAPDVTEPPAASVTPEPTPTPEQATDIAQLQPKSEKFMQPKSLDGIDPLNDKVIALTFDDGPNPVKTPEMLDILKENGVVATFFVVGNLVEEHPGIVKRAYEEGNEIGTHSYTHPEKTWRGMSESEILDEYTKANDAIEAETGLRTLFDRPVGGGMKEEMAEQIGREQIIWSVDPEDWNNAKGYRDADKIYDHVMNGTNGGGKATDGAVVLSHEIYQSTVDAYKKIIPALKEQGYKFVTVSQMMQIAEIRGAEIPYLFHKAPGADEAAAD